MSHSPANSAALRALGSRVRTTRERRGLSQRQLAARIGIGSHTAIQKLEAGDHSPSVLRMCAIADALDVSLDYLCNRPEPDAARDTMRRLAALPAAAQTAILASIEAFEHPKEPACG